jgi:mRNA-degrading endonuclease RelE of RelBE toxin-antitoxin system
LSENPYLGLKLVGALAGFWKDRVGIYRIVYKVEARKIIILYDVDLRKRTYE